MRLFDYIAGFSRYDQELDPRLLSLTMESQRVRVHQSHKALWLVLGAGLVYLYGLWDEVPPVLLSAWIGLIILFAVLRVFVCRRVESKLPNASVPTLYYNEAMLYVTSVASTLAVGSGFWWVGLHGPDRADFAVIMLSLIYAIGTTINSSIHIRGFSGMLIANLGQALVFLLFFAEPVALESAAAMLAILILLIEFGRRNADVFAESIRIRDENREQNAKLEKDKIIIEKALNLARKANEEKNRFMAAASHDLRQPLHAMTLFLGSLRHISTDERMIELVDKIDETSTLLHEQFNSLLDLSKFDAGVVAADLSDFRLDVLLKNIVDAARHEAQPKNLAIHLYATPVTVRSDMLLMERLLRNLVMNAVRYTDRGSVSIQTRRLRQGLSVSIIDTGVGIAPEDQEKIFQDYYQVSNKARTKGKGSGLGLAIVKRIGALLDLKISLKSEVGVGSHFTVLIPARSLQETEESEVTAKLDVLDDMRLRDRDILIVDDDASILDAMAVLLQTWGCHTIRASSPDQVDRLVSHGDPFDLVLLDDMLDDRLSGLDIANKLAAIMPRRRIIMATGNANSARITEIRNAGFKVLIKPVEYTVLLKNLLEALED
jgi:two-component system, sensor histidine kinase